MFDPRSHANMKDSVKVPHNRVDETSLPHPFGSRDDDVVLRVGYPYLGF